MEKDLNNIKLIICENYDEISKKCAEILSLEIQENKNLVIGFATGGTPTGMYKELINLNQKGDVDFSSVTAFNLDEYYPIDKKNSQSYDYFMKEHLFNHINIHQDCCHIPNGQAEDAGQEGQRYENLIREKGGIDFQILGMGSNGHIAFNEPTEIFEKNTRLVNLAENTIKDNSRFFDSIDEVPKHGISMGIKTIMMAKKILLIVSGEKKAEILQASLLGDITPNVPASILQLHHNVIVVCDKAAAAKLN